MSPMNRIPLMRPELPTAGEIAPFLALVDRERRYTNFGPLTVRLERQLEGHFKAPAGGVVTVCNGTVAVAVALAEAARPGRSKCILPGWAFVACALAVEIAGLEACLADVNPDSWTLDMDAASELAARMRDQVAAVLVVAPFGLPVDVAGWHDWSRASGIPVVVDGAAGFDSVQASALPTVVSFHATKAFGIGEGGCVVTTDAGFAERVRARTNFGLPLSRGRSGLAVNGKLSEYAAAVGLAAFDNWPARRRALIAVAERYVQSDRLRAVGRFQPGFARNWIGGTANFELHGGCAEQLRQRLAVLGIETRRWWGRGVLALSEDRNYCSDGLASSRNLDRRVLGLPFFHDLSADDQAAVIDAIAA